MVNKEREPSETVSRSVAVIEVHLCSDNGIYIPILNPTTEARCGQYEFPGGTVEFDHAGHEQLLEMWLQHERTFIKNDDDGSVSEQSVRNNALQVINSNNLRERQWLLNQMINEIRQETGLNISPDELIDLPFNGDGRQILQRLYVTGGSGRPLELILYPFVVRLNVDVLPTLTLSSEHSDYAFLRLAPWDVSSERQMFNKWLEQLRPSMQGQNSVLLLNDEGHRIYSLANSEHGMHDSKFTISAVTGFILNRYLVASYSDEIPLIK